MKIPDKKKSKQTAATDVTYSGLPRVDRPKFTDSLRFPEDITELAAANCSELLGKYTLLWSYVNQNCAHLKIRLLKLQQQESQRVSSLFRENPRLNQIERWKRDAVVSEDERIEIIRGAIASTNMELESTNMYLANFDKYIQALSRELTRKTHEMGLHRS